MATSIEPTSSQRLNDAIAEYNHLVSRIEYPHTAGYHEAHKVLHQVYIDLRKLENTVSLRPHHYYLWTSEILKLRRRAEICRERMCVEKESVRELREALPAVKKKIDELRRQVAAEKRDLLAQANGMEMGG